MIILTYPIGEIAEFAIAPYEVDMRQAATDEAKATEVLARLLIVDALEILRCNVYSKHLIIQLPQDIETVVWLIRNLGICHPALYEGMSKAGGVQLRRLYQNLILAMGMPIATVSDEEAEGMGHVFCCGREARWWEKVAKNLRRTGGDIPRSKVIQRNVSEEPSAEFGLRLHDLEKYVATHCGDASQVPIPWRPERLKVGSQDFGIKGVPNLPKPGSHNAEYHN